MFDVVAIGAQQFELLIHGEPHRNGGLEGTRQRGSDHAVEWTQVLPHETRKGHT